MELRVWTKGTPGITKVLKDVKTVAELYCVQGEKGKEIGVAPPYANRYARNKSDVILLGYQEGSPKAFILATYEETSLYLGVICGMPGTGRFMMDKFLEMADKEGVNVSLSAMPNVLSYYSRKEFGFQFRKSCEGDEEIIDDSSISGKKPPLNLQEIAKDAVFGPFLEKLQEKGFNVVKRGECAKRRMNAEEIINNHCEDDGYTMFRCKVKATKKSRKSPKREGKAEIDVANFNESKGVGKRSIRSPNRLVY